MSPVTTEHCGDIAIVTVDNPPVNALSQAVRAGLVSAVEQANAEPEIKAVILICSGRTFIAGSDIREFNRPPEPPHLPDVIASIEASTKLFIAAIHGTALGGGLEVALVPGKVPELGRVLVLDWVRVRVAVPAVESTVQVRISSYLDRYVRSNLSIRLTLCERRFRVRSGSKQ